MNAPFEPDALAVLWEPVTDLAVLRTYQAASDMTDLEAIAPILGEDPLGGD